MTCATSDCSSPNYGSTPPTSESTLKEFRSKNRTDKQVIDKIWYEIEFIGDDCNLSQERRSQFESRKICGFGINFPKLKILRLPCHSPQRFEWMECVDGFNIDTGTGFDELKKIWYSTIGVTGMPRWDRNIQDVESWCNVWTYDAMFFEV